MIASYPTFPQSDPSMCGIGGISPFRSRTRINHERHNSEYIERPRPTSISAAPSTMLHTKRSSIYVSDASILLQHKNPILSPTSSSDSLSRTNESSGFVDHYASLELPPNASIDEVKSAFRRLRGLYFTQDAKRYRAAQAAFDVLANPIAREDYDAIYRSRPSQHNTSLAEMLEQSKRGRSDSAHSGEDVAMPVLSEEEELEAARSQDANWGLKHHRRLYEPVVGTQPYTSFIPMLVEYEGVQRHPVLGCRRPVYVGKIAVYARPN